MHLPSQTKLGSRRSLNELRRIRGRRSGTQRSLHRGNFDGVCNSPAAFAANAGDIDGSGTNYRPLARPFSARNFRLKRTEPQLLRAATLSKGELKCIQR